MTATQTLPLTASTDDWNAQFAALKARFPKAKDSIVFAIHAIQSNPAIRYRCRRNVRAPNSQSAPGVVDPRD